MQSFKEQLRFVSLDDELVLEIKESLSSGQVYIVGRTDFEGFDDGRDALDQLKNRPLPFVPINYFDDGEIVFFSGGAVPEPVFDFSTGLAVNRKDGSVTTWDVR
jgi:hypothetical protein